MALLLFLIPLFGIASGFYIYRHNGQREFLQLDLIQFLYTFILAPLFFIWAKTFIFFLLRSESTIMLSAGEMFTIDTAFTLFLFYIYAFIVMHSVTKSFRLNTEKDPLYDLFSHSEYIHLWLSHIVMALGLMILLLILALVNLFFPLVTTMGKLTFYLICAAGIVSGSIAFIGLLLTDPRQTGRRYMRLMKLAIGVTFSVLAITYFLVDPQFAGRYSLYWFIFFMFSTMLVWSFFSYRSSKAQAFFNTVINSSKDTPWWGKNSQLFTTSKKK
jgi:hypothetical protein